MTRTKDDLAFPVTAVNDTAREQVNPSTAYGSEAGMTIREYYAARAPEQIPKWFRPKLSEVPLLTQKDIAEYQSLDPESQGAFDVWWKDPCYDPDHTVFEKIAAQLKQNAEDIEVNREANAQSRYF